MEIGSAGGVEDKNEDKNKDEVDVMEKKAKDKDIPKLDGKTNNPTNQPRQLLNPERDSASQNASNQLDDNNDNMRINQLITPPTTLLTTPPNQTTGQEAPRAQEISADLIKDSKSLKPSSEPYLNLCRTIENFKERSKPRTKSYIKKKAEKA
ncbi:hypothetical protein TSTA_007570 [Talaromyces stipitatus ATCC 10500]|uniref:Uncharacterized protein n=1 Tax=Talaromyces stipitatus (strain ATCC 10500 / CBS 375.48 / QM 6759 / NRRL 1006) TaxID=441959 RepID=B8MVF9_TALSN|nr:uncharacterized protein TSTA_007570 [Talaromyces stipitatus ATCC 10500]EED11467.1 hypothetical protein TSTA_007570 [Talaromyces stipitatus ATCC 10500]